ncbi:MAG: tetratricopeptide repeat protein [Chloroflexi bacterium]|nr:tetratricopeptide repeat protein [Chloroflexota bacterium]MDA1174009.1 tetratricopeptide repeat protein [Chloroflexota bacterium]
MVYREAEDVRDLKIQASEAVELAMGGRWEEAAAVNRKVIAASPGDLDAYNRLGKALLELGDPQGARAAFQHSLSLDPSNPIARKNIERLSNGAAASGSTSLSHRMFIGDTGKSTQVALLGCATDSARPYLAPGSSIELRVNKGNVVAYSAQGQYIGIVPPRVGHRLVALMEGGNRYGGGVVTSVADTVRVLLHESYQHPSQRSKTSFPAMAPAPASAAPSTLPEIDPLEPIEELEPVVFKPVAETPAEELRELDGPDAEMEVEFADPLPPLERDEAEDEESLEEEFEEAI